jgi:hypothetical protein
MSNRMLTYCGLMLLIVVGYSAMPIHRTPADQATWGGLKGRFVFDGEPPLPRLLETRGKDADVYRKSPPFDETLLVDPATRGVANVVVYPRRKVEPVHPDAAKKAEQEVELRMKDCRYVPHIVFLHVDQKLAIINDDPIGHIAELQPLADFGNSLLSAGGSTILHSFTRQQFTPFPVTCGIHPWMKAYVLPRRDPYGAVSRADGTFEIFNLPPGEREFQFWHESIGFLEARPTWHEGRAKFKIEAGKTLDLGQIKLSAQRLTMR